MNTLIYSNTHILTYMKKNHSVCVVNVHHKSVWKISRFGMSKSRIDLLLCNRINIVRVIVFDLIGGCSIKCNRQNVNIQIDAKSIRYQRNANKSSQSKVNPVVIRHVCVWISIKLCWIRFAININSSMQHKYPHINALV